MKYIFLVIGLLAFFSGILLLNLDVGEELITVTTMQVVFGAIFLFQFYRMHSQEKKEKKEASGKD